MNTKSKLTVLAAAFAVMSAGAFLPSSASAGTVVVSIGWQAPPPLIIVSPGVQVVEDYDEEVFFIDGYYWVERDGGWYRTRTHSGTWIFVEHGHVAPFLVKHNRGQYKHYKKPKAEKAKSAPAKGNNGNGNGNKGNGNGKGKGK